MVTLLRVGLVATILAAAATPASIVDAQDAPEDRARARQLFEEGLAFAKSEQWEDALSAFRRSSDLVPRASTSYNIANALYRLDRPNEGLAELETYDAMNEVAGDPAAKRRGVTLRALLEAQATEARSAIPPDEPNSLAPTQSTLPPETHEAALDPPKGTEDDRKPFVKRPGFWVMIGAIAAVGIGVGVAVAVTRKDDAPQCGTTGSCATTQGATLASF